MTYPRNPEKGWKLLDHTADIRLEVRGVSLAELFLNAAEGLTAFLAPGSTVRADADIEVSLTSNGPEELLVDWLREILFVNQAREFVFVTAEFEELSDNRLAGRMLGGYGSGAIEPELEIKAVTYHGLTVERDERGYVARILLDV